MKRLLDPLKFAREFWPCFHHRSFGGNMFYKEQVDTIYSVVDNPETVVVAGNKLGKDFTAGFICVWAFLASIKAGLRCRIITTSVAEDHLGVLWAEIGRFVTSCKYNLIYHPTSNPRGPIVLNFQEIKRADEQHNKNPDSYCWGLVAEGGMEKLAGHHAGDGITLLVMDEASGLSDLAYEKGQGWAKRILMFGNPHPCQNMFRRAVKGGNVLAA